jgi:hypothetical protein
VYLYSYNSAAAAYQKSSANKPNETDAKLQYATSSHKNKYYKEAKQNFDIPKQDKKLDLNMIEI